jgi:hypothetical protein
MYIYNYRIYDRFKHPIVSLAILGDDDINWRPDHFILQEGRTIVVRIQVEEGIDKG